MLLELILVPSGSQDSIRLGKVSPRAASRLRQVMDQALHIVAESDAARRTPSLRGSVSSAPSGSEVSPKGHRPLAQGARPPQHPGDSAMARLRRSLDSPLRSAAAAAAAGAAAPVASLAEEQQQEEEEAGLPPLRATPPPRLPGGGAGGPRLADLDEEDFEALLAREKEECERRVGWGRVSSTFAADPGHGWLGPALPSVRCTGGCLGAGVGKRGFFLKPRQR